MKKPFLGSFAGQLLALGLFLSAQAAGAANWQVSANPAVCPRAGYRTIQAAVNAAAAGDTIVVCAGTYAEQITIPAGKDRLTLRSQALHTAVIQAPAVMRDPGDIVLIDGAKQVSVQDFTVTGPLPDALFCSLLLRTGIRVSGGGSAVISRNHVTQIRSASPTLRGCQNGVAIAAGRKSNGEVGSAFIAGNTVDSYQKDGVLVSNAGSAALITGNQVLGDGPTAAIAQNGIQVSDGADAIVEGNQVSGQVYSPMTLSSALLFYHPGRLWIAGNTVSASDYGIITVDATGTAITGNQISGCTNGIDLDEETVGTSRATVAGNQSHDNLQDGIYVSPLSKSNSLDNNHMSGDREFDARDDSAGAGTGGTANTWRGNQCTTDNKGGLLCTTGM